MNAVLVSSSPPTLARYAASFVVVVWTVAGCSSAFSGLPWPSCTW
jgi:hypothetical protein